MEVSLTFDEDVPGDHFMVIAPAAEWKELLNNLDGIGHSPSALKLIAVLRSWGVERS